VITTLGSMKIKRSRLMAASLAMSVVISLLGGYAWSRTVADDDPSVDAELTDAQDRPQLGGPAEIVPNGNVAGEPLPAALLSDRDGNDIATSSLVGDRPLVINFWFSTCAPCAKELPEFSAAHAEFGEEVRFVGVNTIDSIPVMERFASERGVTYELLRDDLAEFTDGIEASNFPVTIFVTSDGTIVEQTGVVDLDGLRDKIANLQAQEALV
jgi:thiol-disulfide isomerase/thioredoxin